MLPIHAIHPIFETSTASYRNLAQFTATWSDFRLPKVGLGRIQPDSALALFPSKAQGPEPEAPAFPPSAAMSKNGDRS
jgi:hypothetical protein